MTVTAKALWYIESHLSGDVSLDAIADAVGVSRFHLSRAFGLTVSAASRSGCRSRHDVGGGVQLARSVFIMIRKLSSGQYRLYSRKADPKTGRRRNLGTFSSRAAAEKHERAVQFFKRHG
jgi:AraC-like DNA-binding protein